MSIGLLLISLFTVVELNCENLFDCQHDSLKNDNEFLPTSARKWNPGKYWHKINHISKEIIACGQSATDSLNVSIPDIAILCEVENDTVMRDLTRRSLLRTANYDYVMTSSEDKRGIDVAMLYSPFTFRLLRTLPFRVPKVQGHEPTRDILYACGIISNGDTLHIYGVHLPSRIGGESGNLHFRMKAAEVLRKAIDSLMLISPKANVIVAGDFNDYAEEDVLKFVQASDLNNISAKAKGSHGAKGTYKYKGEWRSIDQMLISKPLTAKEKSCYIEDHTFLLEDDKTYGGMAPRRTFSGYKYNNGFSDHLPIVTIFAY
jgi:endonuclease/exonuclease/phosphatase family metal-dependent hydrolase